MASQNQPKKQQEDDAARGPTEQQREAPSDKKEAQKVPEQKQRSR